ncbi:MAG TPA: hypothetical protein RMH26_04340 [Polyangiaceae bacterium LLY-WYZ-15_(1-7)]|nr:hypothetical protein [Polyangiaceae bacterium LLY-WYZ-15_(1-7)]
MFDVEMQKVTVREMIDRFNDWGDDHVFLFHSSNVSGDDLCLVVQIDPYDDSMDAPVEVDGERYAHDMIYDSLAQVVENARLQVGDPSLEELVKAFCFYLLNDAFIELK